MLQGCCNLNGSLTNIPRRKIQVLPQSGFNWRTYNRGWLLCKHLCYDHLLPRFWVEGVPHCVTGVLSYFYCYHDNIIAASDQWLSNLASIEVDTPQGPSLCLFCLEPMAPTEPVRLGNYSSITSLWQHCRLRCHSDLCVCVFVCVCVCVCVRVQSTWGSCIGFFPRINEVQREIRAEIKENRAHAWKRRENN